MRDHQTGARSPVFSRRAARISLAVVVTCAALLQVDRRVAASHQAPRIDSKKVEELIRASGAETVAVAFYDLATGEQFNIEPDKSFHAASTMKVPVMMEVYRQAGEGRFSLDDRIPVKNDFISIADSSHYSISADSDSDRSLYNKIGQTETIREMVKLMIDVSSNLAANILIERVGATRVMQLMQEVGATNIRVLRGVEDGKAYDRGLNNTTTARDLLILLRRIAERRAVSKKASDEMIKVMLDQKFNEGIPAGLPSEARVAHKTGSITKINHDAGIVYLPNRKPYVLVVLTRGIEDEKRAHKLIADISRTVYEGLAGVQQINHAK
ncbi:MAG TPA: serine hydrolase [Blastocatellia bacterium]|jgi:beta-lactamase class A|nr:serine hydrolase [Blastocatellia bacterium]